MMLAALLAHSSYDQDADSIPVYQMKEIVVFGKKYQIDHKVFPVEKDNLADVLELGGFSIMRKGVFLAQDVYADGLKRGDYAIVVDGERYHNACPMRMDAPLSRINPIEVESIAMVKSSSNLQAGLGGVIAVNRAAPRQDLGFKGSLTQMSGKSNETDLSLLAEKSNQRISLRYTQGLPHRSGKDDTYRDLYGYKENSRFQFVEASLYGVVDRQKYTGSIMYSDDVLFPYLQMDERESIVYNASLSFKDYKIYLNYTDHLMDNTLRVSNMFMETDGDNMTLGVVSDFFEAYYRYWNADNRIEMANGSMAIYNNILPKVHLYSSNVFKSHELFGFTLTGKIGVSYYDIGNKDVLSFYQAPYPDAKDSRIFPLGGFSIAKSQLLSNSLFFSGMIDVAAEAPEPEPLYVNVRRMMGKPNWNGNPELDQPLRATLRTNFSIPHFSLHLYASYVSNYVYLASVTVGMQKYQTFGNVSAFITGASLKMDYKRLESDISYTYGENTSTNRPLLEILPLHISNRINFPEFQNLRFSIKRTYENAQKRIDAFFMESASSAWNRVDLGMIWTHRTFVIGVDVENILDHTYSKHLSYVRDPFSSGMRIIEPGVLVRVNFGYNY